MIKIHKLQTKNTISIDNPCTNVIKYIQRGYGFRKFVKGLVYLMLKNIKRPFLFVLAIVMLASMIALPAGMAEESTQFANGETLVVYYTLSAAAATKYNSYDEHPAVLLMEEYTGLDLQFVHPPQDDDGTYFSSVVASGMWPDLWKADFSLYPGDVDGAIADGLIVNINDYVNAETAPNWFKYYDALDENGKKNFVNDSGVYTKLGVSLDPEEILNGEQHTGPIVRKDALDALGIESPTTLDEFTAMLYALKDAGYETPLGLYKFSEWDAYNSNFIAGAFGVMLDSTKGFTVDEEGNAHYSQSSEGWKEFLTYLNGLYNDGIIDRDFVNRTEADTKKLLYNGTVACMAVGNWETQEVNLLGKTADENFDIAGIRMPRKDADAPYIYGNRREQATDANNGWQISTTCKNPELAVKFIDFLYSDYGLELTNYGPQEYDGHVIWTQDEDGTYVFSDYMLNNPEVAFNTIRSWYSIDNMQSIYHADYQKMQYDADICWQCWEAWGYNVDNSGHIPVGISLTADESNEVVKKMDSIKTYADEMTYKFILGEASLETEWDAYVATIQDMGIADVEAIYTTATARYNAR